VLKIFSVVLRVIVAVLMMAGFFVFSPFESILSMILIIAGAFFGCGGRGSQDFRQVPIWVD